jgi:hypothetical protein
MKNKFILAIVMVFVSVSCNQKNAEATTVHSHTMGDSTIMNDKNKTMENHEQMYACPMHPEVQGKKDEKCSKCGMKLTEPVAEKTEEK